MFCEGVQHRLQSCLDQLSCVRMAVFRLYLQSGKRRKLGWMGTTVMLFLLKNSLICCHDATASSFVSKVWDEIFAHFHGVAIKCQ
jgi:hypothetical protein